MRWLTVFAVALMIVAAGVFGQSAAAAASKHALPHPGDARRQACTARSAALRRARTPGPSSAPPAWTTGAAAATSENELGSDDGGGLGGKVVHGTIGSALPSAGAAGQDPRPRTGRLMTAGATPFPASSRGEVTPSYAARRRWVGLALSVFLVGNAVAILLIWGGGGADGLGYHWHSFDAALIGLGRV